MGIGALALRLFTVYGPRGRPDMSVGKFVEACLKGERVPLFGDGTVTRDFTYVSDIVAGIVAASDRVRPGTFDVLNLGGSERHSVKELMALIEKECGKKLLIDRHPAAQGDAQTTWALVEKAERLLDWKPKVKFAEGVALTAAWAKARLPSP
jgi:UDP-glucuronate 4-epimerase